MGIHASIYASGDWGRDPLSVLPPGAQEVLVINAEGPFEPRPGDVLVKIESHVFGCARAVPVLPDGSDDKRWLMFGGRFIASSDSRFGQLVEKVILERQRKEYPDARRHHFYGALPLHDRYEP